ncbi:hypothetical protein PBDP_4652 [Pseudomonas sp. St290]|nr:hypothetical protein PBDP_4652 [Pseudomonas sp. St290]
MHRLDEIHGVVVGNELQGVGNALYQVVLLDHGHESRSSLKTGTFNKVPAAWVHRSTGGTSIRHAGHAGATLKRRGSISQAGTLWERAAFVAKGFICGEGIYPRWAAKQP